MNQKLDLTNWQTRKYIYNNYPARIIAVDAKGTCPVVVLFTVGCQEVVTSTNLNGFDCDGQVLFNAPEKRTLDYWVNIYPKSGTFYSSKESADRFHDPERIACVHIVQEFTVGEGLE